MQEIKKGITQEDVCAKFRRLKSRTLREGCRTETTIRTAPLRIPGKQKKTLADKKTKRTTRQSKKEEAKNYKKADSENEKAKTEDDANRDTKRYNKQGRRRYEKMKKEGTRKGTYTSGGEI